MRRRKFWIQTLIVVLMVACGWFIGSTTQQWLSLAFPTATTAIAGKRGVPKLESPRLTTTPVSELDGNTAIVFHQPLLPASILRLLSSKNRMIDVMGNDTLRKKCEVWAERESSSNLAFVETFSRVFKSLNDLPWWLDEGGLIGASRAGSMINADDDFDFFALLPKQHAPCRPDSLTCTHEEFDRMIHPFLMTFWNAGMCINKFHPDPSRFVSKNRLMYSFQLNRRDEVPPDQCFVESKPFAHMHLGILDRQGRLQTNVWAVNTNHPRDIIPLDVVLPATRCRVGPLDAPCPNNITAYLSIRNQGEYRKKSSDGNCLLVRRKWGLERKQKAVEQTRKLAACGYNSIADLIPAFVGSAYRDC